MRCVESPSSPLLFPDRFCYVSSVYVRPAERRQGNSSRAALRGGDVVRGQGITEMRLHSATSSSEAASAWDALGFEVVEHVRRRPLPGAAVASSPAQSAVELR
jgi:hypothetical protein